MHADWPLAVTSPVVHSLQAEAPLALTHLAGQALHVAASSN
jgi:hypothetical protein